VQQSYCRVAELGRSSEITVHSAEATLTKNQTHRILLVAAEPWRGELSEEAARRLIKMLKAN